MKSHLRRAATALFIVALGMSSVANAALVSRLGGAAVYDTDFNITWLADANLAVSNTFGVSGIGTHHPGDMTWTTAQTWIDAMNAANYLDYNDWRLPTTLLPDASCSIAPPPATSGYINCTGSEMGHLFYTELGGVAFTSIVTHNNGSLNLFSNFQPDFYWSSTEFSPTINSAWGLDFGSGIENFLPEVAFDLTLAVRDGDVVPIPAAVWLFGSGLLGLIGIARRKAA